MSSGRLLALCICLLALACEYTETLGSFPGGSRCGGPCTPPATCGGGGDPNACGVNACGGCFDPPPTGGCYPSLRTNGISAMRYAVPGSCDAFSGFCHYDRIEEECPEACTEGVCHPGGLCSFNSLCSASLGCKLASSGELRCTQVDRQQEGELCDETKPGFRCASMHVCVQVSYSSTLVCAELCEDDGDCFAGGLRNQGRCVKTTSLRGYGYCE
jgi:hypothetical protein